MQSAPSGRQQRSGSGGQGQWGSGTLPAGWRRLVGAAATGDKPSQPSSRRASKRASGAFPQSLSQVGKPQATTYATPAAAGRPAAMLGSQRQPAPHQHVWQGGGGGPHVDGIKGLLPLQNAAQHIARPQLQVGWGAGTWQKYAMCAAAGRAGQALVGATDARFGCRAAAESHPGQVEEHMHASFQPRPHSSKQCMLLLHSCRSALQCTHERWALQCRRGWAHLQHAAVQQLSVVGPHILHRLQLGRAVRASCNGRALSRPALCALPRLALSRLQVERAQRAGCVQHVRAPPHPLHHISPAHPTPTCSASSGCFSMPITLPARVWEHLSLQHEAGVTYAGISGKCWWHLAAHGQRGWTGSLRSRGTLGMGTVMSGVWVQRRSLSCVCVCPHAAPAFAVPLPAGATMIPIAADR